MLALLGGLLLAACSVIYYVAIGLWIAGAWLVDRIKQRRQARAARIEAELDRKQAELRRTILLIADGLARDADETSRRMTRAAFLASGTPPEARGQ